MSNVVCFGAIVDFIIIAVAIMLAKLHEMINCVLSMLSGERQLKLRIGLNEKINHAEIKWRKQ